MVPFLRMLPDSPKIYFFPDIQRTLRDIGLEHFIVLAASSRHPAFLIVLLRLILTYVTLFYNTYTPIRWHLFLLYELWNLVALAGLLYGSRVLPILSPISCKRFSIVRGTWVKC